MYAQLQGLPSLRRISEKVKRKKRVLRMAGIVSISKSQFSRKLGDILPEVFQSPCISWFKSYTSYSVPRRPTRLLGTFI
ncbi:hypothetical protein MUO14_09585 [Halobacillus shinanisalinarum]|uniref:Uncharacterized protein n=1 Tax=Halobacillus shinanisalinarum TaxID=2932258 RepID=A0ABY4H5B1_9BACI|nr:hypothetical protein [Halobacillus shinanisalinarum]UOQ95653.1 hypothetical protein MUO14_09585 [Halobacillus shinanisalinarum]